jgi:hypothetical protein
MYKLKDVSMIADIGYQPCSNLWEGLMTWLATTCPFEQAGQDRLPGPELVLE